MTMATFQAFVLGMVQGLGEFLPISSSGHLDRGALAPGLAGARPVLRRGPPRGHARRGALRVRRGLGADPRAAARGRLRGRPFAEPDGRLLGLLALASVPGAVAGLALEKWAETTFRSPLLVAATMAVMGVVLLLAAGRIGGRRAARPGRAACRFPTRCSSASPRPRPSCPGVSRPGSTISMGLFLGYRREDAARFSFLLATPITFGAALVKVPQLFRAGPTMPPSCWACWPPRSSAS